MEERANGLYAAATWTGVWYLGPVNRVLREPPDGAEFESRAAITSSVPQLKVRRM